MILTYIYMTLVLTFQIHSCTKTPLGAQIDYKQTRQNLLNLTKQRLKSRNANNTSLGYLAICAVGKNEQAGVKEWVQYHLHKGVNKIYLFDNGSQPPMIEQLHEFLRTDKLDYFYYKDTYRAEDYKIFKKNLPIVYRNGQYDFQLWAYASCMQWFGHRHKFIAIFDLDEFLVLDNLRQTFPEFLKKYEQFGGVKVYRRFFGSSGHIKQPNGTVLQSYTKCTSSLQAYHKQGNPKQIVNMEFFDGFCFVHSCNTTKPSVNSQIVEETPKNIISGDYIKTFEGIHLNHYFLKSLEDLKYKWERKLGNKVKPSIQKAFHQWFDELDKMSQTDCLEGIELSRQCCASLAA